MPQSPEVGALKVLVTVGFQAITSGNANILGVGFVGSATGSYQIFAGVTGSASLTPVITFCATTSAVAGGFSPMFFRMPFAVSGAGFSVNVPTTADPNLLIYWCPMGGP